MQQTYNHVSYQSSINREIEFERVGRTIFGIKFPPTIFKPNRDASFIFIFTRKENSRFELMYNNNVEYMLTQIQLCQIQVSCEAYTCFVVETQDIGVYESL